MIRETSREAFKFIKENQSLGRMQTLVYEQLCAFKEGLTNKELSRRLGLEINKITPRVGELRKAGLVVDGGTKKDPESGRNAHIWQVIDEQLNLF